MITDSLLTSLSEARIEEAVFFDVGQQLKFKITLEGGQTALFKPQRLTGLVHYNIVYNVNYTRTLYNEQCTCTLVYLHINVQYRLQVINTTQLERRCKLMGNAAPTLPTLNLALIYICEV